MVENIIMSLRGIRTHKLRSVLTMLGVIIGIASIIGIVSIVEGTNIKLEKSLIGSGNNVATIAISENGDEYNMAYGSIPLGISVINDQMLEKINSLRGVESASTFLKRNVSDAGIYYKNYQLSNGNLLGVNNDFFDTMQYSIIEGRGFNEEEIKKGMKVAIIDSDARDALFDDESPIGKVIEIKKEPYVIVGVSKDFTKNGPEYESIDDYYMYVYSSSLSNVYIPQKTWPLLFNFDEPQNVAVHVTKTSLMLRVGNRVTNLLNNFVQNENQRYAALSLAENENERKTLTNTISLMLVAIASLSLLVGGIGVMNIMLVSVTERTPEIGLKKALGAKNKTILVQFLTESAVLTSFGGILGIIVGIIFARIISYAADLEFAVPVYWIIIAVIFSVMIGALFGAMPAYRAAKLNPIEALRRE